MKKTLTAFALLIGITSFSQRNNIKVGIPGLFLKHLNLKYERVMTENTSLNLTVGNLLARKVEISDDNGDRYSVNTNGIYVIPEYRFYLGSDKDAPRGFYIAPYLRYYKYGMDYTAYEDSVNATVKGSLSSIGVGAQFGAQWLIADRVSIDLHFFGIGVDNQTFQFDLTTNQNVDLRDYEDDFTEDVEEFPIIGSSLQVTSTADKLTAKAVKPGIGLRGGLSIGFAF